MVEMMIKDVEDRRHVKLARCSNFESGTPTSAIDLQVLDLLSDAHRLALVQWLEQLRQHKLEWTRPSSLNLFGGDVDQSRGIHAQFYPNVTSTSWRKPLPQRPFMDAFAPIYIFIEPVQDLDSRKPYSGIVQRLWAEICVDVVQFSLFGHLQPVGTFNMCRDIVVVDADLANETVPTGIFDSFQHGLNVEGFVDFFVQPDIQTFLPVLVQKVQCLSDPDLQIRLHPVLLPVLPIKLEQLSTLDSIDELKAALSGKITGLEMAFLKLTLEGLNTLRAQMSEIIAYINRRDEKRGKRVVGSPPDHRSRPSGGGRSSSEPSRKRGGSYRRRGSRSLGSNRWFS
ncbi:auxin response factor 2 [Dorcoceras hygrometricum]|uniref:Auxin response factor 2 n=1 Tax=Dorcoceras hygrometricum TaxID=472368 RepID=A0A2Z7B6L2_9LAMI|nr:auxin response factor 2 [Dorcoceras hygrometricum]